MNGHLSLASDLPAPFLELHVEEGLQSLLLYFLPNIAEVFINTDLRPGSGLQGPCLWKSCLCFLPLSAVMD